MLYKAESEASCAVRFVGFEVRSPCAPLRRARCKRNACHAIETAMRPTGVQLPRRIRPEPAPKAANPMGLQVAARLTWSNQRFEQVTSWRLVSCVSSCNPRRIAGGAFCKSDEFSDTRQKSQRDFWSRSDWLGQIENLSEPPAPARILPLYQ